MNGDEWRVEVDLDDEEQHFTLGERIRALDLDADARAATGRVGHRHARRPAHVPLRDERGGRPRGERVVRDLIAAEGLAAEVRVTRWHPVEEAWRDAT